MFICIITITKFKNPQRLWDFAATYIGEVVASQPGPIAAGGGMSWRITDIDTNYFAGKLRRFLTCRQDPVRTYPHDKMFYGESGCREGIWVEGFGILPLEGVGRTFFSTNDSEVICYKADGVLLYKNENYCDCSFGEVGIDEADLQTDIAVFPNPAKENINVSYNTADGGCIFALYDVNGTELFTEKLNGNKGERIIDLHELLSGTYYYKITSGNKTIKADKLVIIR